MKGTQSQTWEINAKHKQFEQSQENGVIPSEFIANFIESKNKINWIYRNFSLLKYIFIQSIWAGKTTTTTANVTDGEETKELAKVIILYRIRLANRIKRNLQKKTHIPNYYSIMCVVAKATFEFHQNWNTWKIAIAKKLNMKDGNMTSGELLFAAMDK